MSRTFYADLPIHDRFAAIVDPAAYRAVPADWSVLLADVQGSTQAIAAGRYKEVNMVGAAAIVAVLNACRDVDLPYVFGGDGATLLVPPDQVEAASAALRATRALAADQFGLTLRVGCVPVADLVAAGVPVHIAKVRVSAYNAQAAFTGGGLAYAERLVKDPATQARYALHDADAPLPADYTGLECRWKDVRSPRDETVALLVTATTGTPAGDAAVYGDVLAYLDVHIGTDERALPVTAEALRPAYGPARLRQETKVRAQPGWWAQQRYLWEIAFRNVLLQLFLWFDVQTGDTRWRRYLDLLVASSDYKKYDDTLRMVLACTAPQRQALAAFLEDRAQQGRLAYGLHVTDRAFVTCVVFERMGRQVHFVDAADGGYALAAVHLKARQRQGTGGGMDG